MEDHLDSFVCPITHEVMADPVVACDGHSYDRSSITRWFRDNNTSPITNATVQHKQLVPNHALKQAIHEFRERFAPFFDATTVAAMAKLSIISTSTHTLPMEPLPERGTFIYCVVRPMPVFLAPSFVTARQASLEMDTIVIGKERLYGEDNVVFVELSGHHEGKYVYEARDGLRFLERLDVHAALAIYVVSATTPLSLWPSPTVPSNSLYKAYPWDVLSIEATIEDPAGRMYGRLEHSKLWVLLSDDEHLSQWSLDTTPHLFLLPHPVELCSNANTTHLGVPLVEVPAYSLVQTDASVRIDGTWYLRTTYHNSVGWLTVADADAEPLTAPPPRLAEGPAGKLIQLVLQHGSMALVLDEIHENGSMSQRLFLQHLPRRFERQLLNCAQKGRRVHRMALGPRGQWYCSGARPDGTGECCWASDDLPPRFQADMEPNSLVTFGDDDEYAMVLGSGGISSQQLSTSLLHRLNGSKRVHMMLLARYGGYVVKDNRGLDCSCLDPEFDAALKHPPRGAGQICSGMLTPNSNAGLTAYVSAAVYSDDDYVVLFEHAFVASSAIATTVVEALRAFYARHRAVCLKRRQLIAEYEQLHQLIYTS
ncbi:Aste57867_10277 [Aphanomyces stellatus]|uniref:Aste57867_10277 protein n=1 Tax=Aphanomyces stellatus TaxID=120398 RepID=A0A485KQG4_9STRA|nr:hypothetical protein As57867_010237 [Aphanomyces stellatus]VFT87151.1 Aste57867_10277 [Aphanomyces stellatus]